MTIRMGLPVLLVLAGMAWPGIARAEHDDDDQGERPMYGKKGPHERPPLDDNQAKDGPPRGPSHDEILRLIERFDVDRDGRLSDEEKAKLLAHLQSRLGEPRDRKPGEGEDSKERNGPPDGKDRDGCERDQKFRPEGPPERFRPEGPPKGPPPMRKDGPKGPPPMHRDGPKGPPLRDGDCTCHHPDGPRERPDAKGRPGDPPNESGGRGSKGNNGVGNGEDPQPPGNPPVNDGAGTGPGRPGNKHRR